MPLLGTFATDIVSSAHCVSAALSPSGLRLLPQPRSVAPGSPLAKGLEDGLSAAGAAACGRAQAAGGQGIGCASGRGLGAAKRPRFRRGASGTPGPVPFNTAAQLAEAKDRGAPYTRSWWRVRLRLLRQSLQRPLMIRRWPCARNWCCEATASQIRRISSLENSISFWQPVQ